MNTGTFLIIAMIILYIFYISKRILDIIELRLTEPKRMDKYKRCDFLNDDFI